MSSKNQNGCDWCGKLDKDLKKIAYYSKVYKSRISITLCPECIEIKHKQEEKK